MTREEGITIDKAIEILDVRPGQSSFFLTPERLEALQLGTEALKWVKELHKVEWCKNLLLPGETEE